MFLKVKVQQSWGEDFGKENIDVNKTQQNLEYAQPIPYGEKCFLRENVFKALDTASNKTI